MTNTQLATLRWLAEIGGVCVAWRDKVAHPRYAAMNLAKLLAHMEGREREVMPSVSALHLVQAGCIEARGGQLHITDKGRRHLEPFRKAAA